MIIVSAGMQKSGSAYLYNIINDLLVNAGQADARQVKEKHKLEGLQQWHNNNVGNLEDKLLCKLTLISVFGKNFAVKTHSGPTVLLKRLMKFGLAKVIYGYRDPRDVLLSAMDHGKKIIAEGQNHTFAGMVDFDIALENVNQWLCIWEQYERMDNVLKIKYEELLQQPEATTDRICSYLRLNVKRKEIDAILFKYDRNNKNADMKGLHFNKAKIGRYKDEFSEQELQKVNTALGKIILKMGYPVPE